MLSMIFSRHNHINFSVHTESNQIVPSFLSNFLGVTGKIYWDIFP